MSSFELDQQQAQVDKVNPNGHIDHDRAVGVIMLAAGSAAFSGGLAGMDSVEARTPEDAIGSVYIGESQTYITPEDVPYAGSAGLGLAVAATGLYFMLRRRQK